MRSAVIVLFVLAACGKDSAPRRVEPHIDRVTVPAGWYSTGCLGWPVTGAEADDEALAYDCIREAPPRRVWLSSFAIDRREVSRADYAACVAEGACGETPVHDFDVETYSGDNDVKRYPARVPYPDAERYCTWARGRIPTAAEWEKAARGDGERLFPWGNQPPTCEYAALESQAECEPYEPVDRPTKGASPYGAIDMYGNAGEWTREAMPDDRWNSGADINAVRFHTRDGVLWFDWTSAKLSYRDTRLVNPHIEPPHGGDHLVKGTPFRPNIWEGSHEDSNSHRLSNPRVPETPIAGIRCAHDLEGPPPPDLPDPAPANPSYPYRESTP